MNTPIETKARLVQNCLNTMLQASLPVSSVSITNAGAMYVSAWSTQPTAQQQAQAVTIASSFTPVNYNGVDCYDGVDIDRQTNERIGEAMAPGRPDDLQEIEQRRLIAETVAILAVKEITGTISQDDSAKLQENLAKWLAVKAISDEGRAIKTANGW